MKNPATLLAPAVLALLATSASAQITLDASGGIIPEHLICTLGGTVPANDFVVLTFSDTTGPLNVGDLLPGEPGYWDQDITMFSYPAFVDVSTYTNPLGDVDLQYLSTSLNGIHAFAQAWTTDLGSPFLHLKSNVVTIILGVHGMSAYTLLGPQSPHAYFSCVPLNDGNVFCSGGAGSLGGAASGVSEVYDYKTSTYFLTANQPAARASSATVKLADGRILICGGIDSTGVVVNTAEIYNPTTNSFSAVANMNVTRAAHQGVLLNDGRVFVCGGSTSISGADPVSQLLSIVSSATATTEIYDPTANTWTSKASMSGGARTAHAASILPDGRVLIAGGVQSLFGIPIFLTSATRYAASSNSYTLTASLSNGGRILSVPTKLADGRVLLTGGLTADLTAQTVTAVTSVSVYNNSTNTWANSNMATGRYAHTATLLPSGEVLVTGGVTGTASSTTAAVTTITCEGFTTSNTWAARPSMLEYRAAHGAALTKDGKRVLLVAGSNDAGVIDPATSELYVP
ncbi:MAG: hypothetical protein HY286_18635 [Planctomycetes bacterium]|nr:hypothetical protein [Planctomycetota bacterium]